MVSEKAQNGSQEDSGKSGTFIRDKRLTSKAQRTIGQGLGRSSKMIVEKHNLEQWAPGLNEAEALETPLVLNGQGRSRRRIATA